MGRRKIKLVLIERWLIFKNLINEFNKKFKLWYLGKFEVWLRLFFFFFVKMKLGICLMDIILFFLL